jgi:polyisoprenoid-binding protein YceI
MQPSKLRAGFVFLSFLLISASAFAADTYKIDPNHTSVNFTVTHLMINQVHGNFTDFDGVITYDEKDPSKCSVEVHIKAASVDTRNTMRDNDIRSEHFFDVAKFPDITFKSTSVEKKGDGYILHGPMTLHGVTRNVAIPFTIGGTAKDPGGNIRLSAEGSFTIDRRDFGVTRNTTLEGGGLLISNDVKIELGIEAVKQP